MAGGADAELQPYPYDPKKARQLLAEAGYPNGFETKIYSYVTADLPELPRLAEAVADYLGRVGVKAKITAIDRAALSTKRVAKTLAGELLPWSTPNRSVPIQIATIINTLHHSKAQFTSTAVPELDQMLERALATTDVKEVEKLVGEMHRFLYHNAHNVTIGETYTNYAANKKILAWDLGGICTIIIYASDPGHVVQDNWYPSSFGTVPNCSLHKPWLPHKDIEWTLTSLLARHHVWSSCAPMGVLIPELFIDDAFERFIALEVLQIAHETIDIPSGAILAGSSRVWGHHHILHVPQGTVRRQGLAWCHVKRGTAKLPGLQRLDQGIFNDYLPARDVDEQGARFHVRKGLGIEQSARLGVRGQQIATTSDVARSVAKNVGRCTRTLQGIGQDRDRWPDSASRRLSSSCHSAARPTKANDAHGQATEPTI